VRVKGLRLVFAFTASRSELSWSLVVSVAVKFICRLLTELSSSVRRVRYSSLVVFVWVYWVCCSCSLFCKSAICSSNAEINFEFELICISCE